MPSSYQVVLWKQESFVVHRLSQIEFFRSLLGIKKIDSIGTTLLSVPGRHMPASWQTCYHESGHALVALSMNMLHFNGIILKTDTDAYTCIIENPDGSEQWCIKRVAIKLAGPLGRMLYQGQDIHWDLMRSTGEYHTDHEDALEIVRSYLKLRPHVWVDERIDELMNRAARSAIEVLRPSQLKLATIASAASGKDQLYRDEIAAMISK